MPQALDESGGAQDGRGVEEGGVFAVTVVAPAVEDDGRDAGLGYEVEDVLVPGRKVAVVESHLSEAVILRGRIRGQAVTR